LKGLRAEKGAWYKGNAVWEEIARVNNANAMQD
jgi:hypothetical protein